MRTHPGHINNYLISSLLACCLVISLTSKAQVTTATPSDEWLRYYHPLDKLDTDTTTGNYLRTLIGNATVVMLGEPTHGEGAVTTAKIQLVKWLHEKMGFDILAFESGLFDMWCADKAIQQGINTHTALRKGLFGIWTHSRQFQPMIDYLQQQNNTLRVAGFDAQLTGSYSTDSLVTTIKQLLGPGINDQLRDQLDTYDEAISEMATNFSFPADINYNTFESISNKLIRLLTAVKPAANPDKEQRQVVLQTIKSTLTLAKDYHLHHIADKTETTFKASDSNPRDAQMADNLLFLLKQYPDKKIICWGASLHFAGNTALLNNEELRSYLPMGSYIRKTLGKKLINIISTVGSGQYGFSNEKAVPVPPPPVGTLEALLQQAPPKTGMLDLHSLPPSLTSRAFDYTPLTGHWQSVGDALLFVQQTTPSLPLEPQKDTSAVNNTVTPTTTNGSNTPPGKKISGIVKDARTGQAIGFSSLQFRQEKITTIASIDGEFALNRPGSEQDSLWISCMGYQTKILPAASLTDSITILLQPGIGLREVTISAKRMDATSIFKAALKQIPQQFLLSSFNATCYARTVTRNFDTLLYDHEFIADIYAQGGYSDREQYVSDVNKANLRIESPFKDRLRYIPMKGTSAWLNEADMLKVYPVFNPDRTKKYKFIIDSLIYNDGDTIYVIRFDATKTSYRYTHSFYINKCYGKVYIRATDMAIIQVEIFVDSDTATINRFARKYYRQNGMPAWDYQLNQHQLHRVAFYQRDTSSGRYVLKHGLAEWKIKGKDSRSDGDINIRSSMLYYLNNVHTGDLRILDSRTARFELYKLPTNEQFWHNYNRPLTGYE